jgi:hypothetical protein
LQRQPLALTLDLGEQFGQVVHRLALHALVVDTDLRAEHGAHHLRLDTGEPRLVLELVGLVVVDVQQLVADFERLVGRSL